MSNTPSDVGKVSLPIGSNVCSSTSNSNQEVLSVPPVILKETFSLSLESLNLILPPLALKASSTLYWLVPSASVADIASLVILPTLELLPLIIPLPGSAIVVV